MTKYRKYTVDPIFPHLSRRFTLPLLKVEYAIFVPSGAVTPP